MKKGTILAVAVAMAGTGLALLQGGPKGLLDRHAAALAESQSLQAELTIQPIGGAPQRLRIALAKPNLFRLESDEVLMVSDGKELVTLDKKENRFARQPLSEALLASSFDKSEWALWLPFFQRGALEKASAVRSVAPRVRRGVSLQGVEVDWPGKLGRATLYFDAKDGVLRQAEWSVQQTDGRRTLVMDARSLALGGSLAVAAFAFEPPSGSRQVAPEELSAPKWYKDHSQALAAASKANKFVFIDFYTEWCGWCKELKKNVFPSAEFQAMSKHFVFVEVDAEANPQLAQTYGVEAYPTCVITDAQGRLVHKIVGYKEKAEFVAEMKQAIGLR
ncbi:MAG: thioredoxin domain-containing protein [Fimbriimonadales bacterium]|nr:thioredoxin domain-containing protein [Fimbriimonadales bacterium]